MKLWLIERIEETPWDQLARCVVRAEDEQRAREIANSLEQFRDHIGNGYSAPMSWRDDNTLDAAVFTCKELTVDGEAGLIIADVAEG